MSSHILSKSTYMRGRRCPKALWLYKNRRDLLLQADAQKQAVFDTGTEVGVLARGLFPGGVDCTPEHHYDYAPSISATQAAITSGANVIYEAAFLHEGVLAALDILVRTSEGWKAYEVKSSNSVSDDHVDDVALQAHVIQGAGLTLEDVSIIHLNRDYVRRGELDVDQLFTISSVKDRLAVDPGSVPARIDALKTMLALGQEPTISIGSQCDSPYICDFKSHCWAHVPDERSVFDLTRGGKRSWSLYERGIMRLEDIPDDEVLTAAQQIQVEGSKRGTTVIDRPHIAEFVRSLQYPLHHFDFETFATAVPMYDAVRPHQHIPFQYSVHIQAEPGAEPEPRAFLADGKGEPREALVEQLLKDLGAAGDVLVYNAAFERGKLNDLARDFPQYSEPICRVIDRMKDLMLPFQKMWYYVPAMNGSYSLKSVLPAIVPELRYDALNIQEGGTASFLYGQLAQGKDVGDPVKLREDLLAYCGLDTMAMVRILDVLHCL